MRALGRHCYGPSVSARTGRAEFLGKLNEFWALSLLARPDQTMGRRGFFNKAKEPLKRFGRVVSHHGHNVMVELLDQPDSRVFPCSLKGKGKSSLQLAPVVGDYVLCHIPIENNTGQDTFGFVTDQLPRRSLLARAKDKVGTSQPLAANVDHLVVVVAPEPPFATLCLDRFLMAAHLAGMSACIIFNKTDYLDKLPQEQVQELEHTLATYKALGYPILRTSAYDPVDYSLESVRRLLMQSRGSQSLLAAREQGKEQLLEGLYLPHAQVPFPNIPLTEDAPAWYMDWLEGRDEAKYMQPTWAFVGQSGSGKSSILNALLPDLDLTVRELSQAGRGKHTTSAATLHRLAFLSPPPTSFPSSKSNFAPGSPARTTANANMSRRARPALSPQNIAHNLLTAPRDWQDLGPTPADDSHIVTSLTKPLGRVSILDSAGFEHYFPPRTKPHLLKAAYPDFELHSQGCKRPQDCMHVPFTDAKVCGVRRAAREGRLPQWRIYSYDYVLDTLRDFDEEMKKRKPKKMGSLRAAKKDVGQKRFPWRGDPEYQENSPLPRFTNKRPTPEQYGF
eukprot:g95.t1